jgi:Ran-binding protein 9/10
MPWFKPFSHNNQQKVTPQIPESDVPPEWTAALERPHTYGLRNEATDDEYESAERFCQRNPLETPKLLPSQVVDRIAEEGCRLWTLEYPVSARFAGCITARDEKSNGITKVVTERQCGDICLMSNLPIMAGLYDIQGKSGIYYEICIQKMEGIIAIGLSHHSRRSCSI